MNNYLYHNAIAFDQMFNAITGGYADETFSSRVYRNAKTSSIWAHIQNIVDSMFFWQEKHCENSYIAELQRKHSHKDFA